MNDLIFRGITKEQSKAAHRAARLCKKGAKAHPPVYLTLKIWFMS